LMGEVSEQDRRLVVDEIAHIGRSPCHSDEQSNQPQLPLTAEHFEDSGSSQVRFLTSS
jgi:hypothetical protein